MKTNKVIKIAKKEVGYLEKKSNSQLDSKKANAGSANYTKYARDTYKWKLYNGNKQGQPWCDMFADWCFVKAEDGNIKKAMGAIYQPLGSTGAGTSFSAAFYKSANKFYKSPKKGDQVFFQQYGKIVHTGLVYKVDNKYVYTIEGNTSSASGVVANGGAVAKKKYALGYIGIAGYGRPKYEKETDKKKDDQLPFKIKTEKKILPARKSPTILSKVVSKVPIGTIKTIIATKSNWYQTKKGNWINKKYCKKI